MRIKYKDLVNFIKSHPEIDGDIEIAITKEFKEQMDKIVAGSYCSSYHTKEVATPIFNQFTGNIVDYIPSEVGVCWGTRECDECKCGGDKTKCDFYPENRSLGN